MQTRKLWFTSLDLTEEIDIITCLTIYNLIDVFIFSHILKPQFFIFYFNIIYYMLFPVISAKVSQQPPSPVMMLSVKFFPFSKWNASVNHGILLFLILNLLNFTSTSSARNPYLTLYPPNNNPYSVIKRILIHSTSLRFFIMIHPRLIRF